jgi:hypothetical protein
MGPSTRTERGLRYQALAEGYKLLKPELAETYQFAADYYDHSDPSLVETNEDEHKGPAAR